MTTIRVERRHRYTSIDRGTINDSRLSFRARGILTYLLDKPDDWRSNAAAISAAGPEGREAVRTVLRELEIHGYLERKKWRNLSGQWETEWIVRERPKEANADSRARVTGTGYPTPDLRAVLPTTETEDGPRETLFDSSSISPPVPPTWVRVGMTYDAWVLSGGLTDEQEDAG